MQVTVSLLFQYIFYCSYKIYQGSKLLQIINHDILSARIIVDDMVFLLEKSLKTILLFSKHFYILMNELGIHLKWHNIIAH